MLQNTAKLGIEWETFNVGAEGRVTFVQPDANSIALNRVLGSDPSRILGALDANGKVFLLNPHGVIFGKNAQVNTGGLLASTLDLSDADFIAGNYTLRNNGRAASILNEGSLTAGSVVLVAPSITNTGNITTPDGNTTLAAGNTVTVSVFANGLMTANVDEAVLNASIVNHGRIAADGGSISLQAGTADSVLDSLLNTDGVLQARGIEERDGKIFLGAGAGGTAYIGGTVDTSNTGAAGSGGDITALGKKVALVKDALLDASGTNGGGTVLIGGNWQGAGPEYNADAVVMDQTARIDASATQHGDGGTVVLWSDEYTNFAGSIASRGGALAGNGGRVETSSKNNLQAVGLVDASAPLGSAGEWLLDPTNVNVSTSATSSGTFDGGNPNIFTPTGTTANILNTQINTSLNAGTSVTITTASAGASLGDININAPITKSAGGDATLTLLANRHIFLNSGNAISSTVGKLNVVMRARAADAATTGTALGGIWLDGNVLTNGGDFTAGGGNAAGSYAYNNGAQAFRLFANRILDARSSTGGGNINVWGKSVGGVTAVDIQTSAKIYTNGTGTITLRGEIPSGGTGFGLWLVDGTSVTAEQGAIDIYGEARGAFAGLNMSPSTVSTTTGAITMTGVSDINTGFYRTTAAGTAAITSTSGNITINGRAGSAAIIPTHISTGTFNVTTGGKITFNSDGGNSGAGLELNSPGSVSAGTGIEINHTGTTLSSYSLNNTGGVTFATTSGDVVINAQRAINNPYAISTGNGAVTITNTASTGGQVNMLAGISSGGGNINLSLIGPTQISGVVNAGAGNISMTSTSATGGALSLMSGSKLQTTGTGTISATGINSSNNSVGLFLNTGAEVTSAAGAITLIGTNNNAAAAGGAIGTYMTGVTVTSGTGNIYIKGENLGTDVAFYRPASSTTPTNITSTGGNITIEGAGNGPNVAQGLLFDTTATTAVNITTGGAGKVSVLGRGGTGRWTADRSYAAIEFGQNITTATVVNLTAGTGGIAITGTASSASTQYIIDTYGTGSTMTSAGPIVISGDGAFGFGGTITTTSTLAATGNRAYASRLAGVTASGNVNIVTLSDFTLGSLTKPAAASTASLLNISSDTNITTGAITALAGAAPLNVVLNSRAHDAASGTITLNGSVTTLGGDVTAYGGSTAGGYAIGPTTGISVATTIEAGGGNISLFGSTAGSGAGVSVAANAIVRTSGAGKVTLTGTNSASGYGVGFGAAVTITSGTGGLLLTGSSNATHGIAILSGTYSSAGDIAFIGSSVTGNGIGRDSGGAVTTAITATGNVSFTGSTTASAGVSAGIWFNGSNQLNVTGAGVSLTSTGGLNSTRLGQSGNSSAMNINAGANGITINATSNGAAGTNAFDTWGNTATMVSAGPINITTNRGFYFRGSITQTDGGASAITAGGTVVLGTTAQNAGALTVTANGGSITNVDGPMSAAGALTLNAIGGTIGVLALSAGGDLTGTSTSSITTNAITQTGNGIINLNAATDLTTGAITTAGSGDITLRSVNAITTAAVTKQATAAGPSTLRVSSDGNVIVGSAISAASGAGALNVVLNSRASDAPAGVINVNAAITTRGGNITGYGGSTVGGDAIASSSYAVSIAAVTLDAGGGNIDFNARTTVNANAMNSSDGAQLLTSGSGAVRLQGTAAAAGRGISIGTATITAGTGGISITGSSNGNAAVAFISGTHSITTTGDLTVTGTSVSNNGLWRNATGTSTFSGANVTFTGNSTGATTSQQGLMFDGAGAVAITAGSAGKVTLLGSGGAVNSLSSKAAIAFGESGILTPVAITAGTGGVQITGTAADVATHSLDTWGSTNSITSAGPINISGNKAVYFRGAITQSAGGPSTIASSGGNILITSVAQNGGALTLDAPAGFVNLTGVMSAAGDLTVRAGSGTITAGNVSSGGSLTATSSSSISVGTVNLTGDTASSITAATTLATGAITLGGSGDLSLRSASALTPAAVTKTVAGTGASTLRITSDDAVTVSSAIQAAAGAGPLNVILNSRAQNAASGLIFVNAAITTRGGDIIGYGGSTVGGDAIGASTNYGVEIGVVTLNAGGGTIDFTGRGLASGNGINTTDGAQLLTSGSGAVRLRGSTAGTARGVSIGTITVTAGTGGISITGTASSATGVAFVAGAHSLNTTGDLAITGTSTTSNGIYRTSTAADTFAGANVTLTGNSSGGATSSQGILIVGTGAVAITAGSTGQVTLAGTGGSTNTFSSKSAIAFGSSTESTAVAITAGTGGVAITGTAATAATLSLDTFATTNSITSGGVISINGNKAINFRGPITQSAGGASNVTATTGDVTLTSFAQNSGPLTVQATAGNVTSTGALSTNGGALVVRAGAGNVSTGALTAGSPLTVTATGSLNTGDMTKAGTGDVTVTAGTTATIGNVSIAGSGVSNFTAGTTLTTGTFNDGDTGATTLTAGTTLTTGAITMSGAGDLTLFSDSTLTPAAITKTATGTSTLTLRGNGDIIDQNPITANVGAGPLNLVVNSRAGGAAAGRIQFSLNADVTTRGGDITFYGGPTAGGAAISTTVGQTGIFIGGRTFDAGGGNITMTGAGGGTNTSGALLTRQATLTTSGAGGITLNGNAGTNGQWGVDIETSTLTSGTGGTTLSGLSTVGAATYVLNSTLTSTGDITVTGTASALGGIGVQFLTTTGNTLGMTAGGNLTITGSQTHTVSGANNAISMTGPGAINLGSTAAGSVTISGTNTASDSTSVPIVFGTSSVFTPVNITGGTGGVTITGTTASTTANAITAYGTAGSIVASGPVRLTGNRSISYLSPITGNTTAGTITVNPSVGNVTLGAMTADGDIFVNTPGTFTSSANITARGTANITLRTNGMTGFTGLASGPNLLRLEPYDIASSIAVGTGATGVLQFASTMFSGASRRFADGFSQVVIGREDGASAISLGSLTFTDPVSLIAPAGGSLSANSTVYNTGGGLTVRVSGSIQFGYSQTISTSGGTNNDIVLSSNTFFDQSGTANPLMPTDGRWIIYLPEPGSADSGSTPLISGNTAVWGKTYATLAPTSVPAGNRYVFALAPGLNINTTNVSKTYGNDGSAIVAAAITATFTPQVTAMNGWGTLYNAITPAEALGDVSQFALTSPGSAVTANVGTYAITYGNKPTTLASGFTPYYYQFGQLTVAARPITIQANAGLTKVYGTDDPAGLGTQFTVIGGLVNGNTITGSMSRADGQDAGSYAFGIGSLTANDGNSGLNYTITVDGATNPFVITPAPLTATIANQTKVYGANDPTLGGIAATVGGLIVNRTVSDVNGNLTVIDDAGLVTATVASLTRAAGEDVGTRNITAATFNLSGSAGGNYTAPTYNGSATLTITPAPLTATIANQSKVYGNADPALSSITPTLNGAVNRAVTTWNGTVNVNDTDLAVTLSSLTRATGEDVGTRAITAATFNPLTGTSASNYQAPTLTGTPILTITPRALTASIANQTKVYGQNDPLLSGIAPVLANVVNGTFSTWNGNVTVNDVGLVAATVTGLTRAANEDVGTYNITAATFGSLTGSRAGNYSAPTLTGTPTLTITRAPLTASIANQTKTYGNDDPLLSGIAVTLNAVNRTVTSWYGSTAINDTGNVTATVTGLTRAAGENVGSYNITGATLSTPTGSRASNYSNSATFTGTPTLTISQRALTATLANQSKVYGNDDPLLSGIVPTLNVVNRSVTTWNGAVTVNDTANVATTLTDLDRAAGENVGSYNITGATFTALTGSSAGNYLAPTLSGTPTLTITARTLLATVSNQTKVYGADDPALAGIVPSLNIVNRSVVTWDGTINVNDTGNVSTTLASLTRQAGEDVGTRNITAATFTALTGSRAGNYTAPTLNGTPTLTISAAPLSATVANQTKVYGNADPALAGITPTLNGLINRSVTTWNGAVAVDDSSVAVTLSSLTRAVGEDVGVRNITAATFNALTGSGASNYQAPTLSGTPTLTITTRPLTATIADQTKVYGQNDPLLSGIAPVLANVVNGTFSTWNGNVTLNDTANVNVTLAGLTRAANEDVGTYNITAATFNALTGSRASNYSGPTLTGTPTLTITRAPLTASIANQTKTYGNDDPLLSGIAVTLNAVNRTVTSWYGSTAINDTGNVTATATGLTRAAGENVGSYNITGATLSTPTGSRASNYSNTATFTGTPTLTISQRALTATVANQTKVYGNDDPLLSGIAPTLNVVNRSVTTWNGAVTVNDSANVSTTLSDLNRAAGENVGSYNITGATFTALTGSAAGNYLAPTLSGTPTLTITARALLATLANQTKVYGADDPTLASIVPSLNIVNRGVVTWDGTIAVNDTGNVSTTLASLTRQAGEDVGTRNITAATFTALTGSRAGNYATPTLNGTPTLTITAAPLTASIANQAKVYGNADPALAGITPTLNGLVNRTVVSWNGNVAVNDSANVIVTLASLTRTVGEDVGTRNITAATFNALTGTAAGNYSAPTLSGTPTLTITARPLTATLADQTKVYGQNDPSLSGITPVLANVVNGTFSTWNGNVTVNDTANVSVTLAGLTRAANEDVGTYNITAATFNALTGSRASNYSGPTLTGTPTLTITRAPLIGSIANQTKTYGNDDPLLSSIVVTLDAVNRTVTSWYGSTTINDTGNVTATVTGLTRIAGENVGSYNITGATLSTPTGSRASNYSSSATFTGTPTLTISQRALTATVANQTKVYGNDDPLLSGIVPTLNAVNRSVTTWNGAVTVNDTASVATTLSDLNRAAGENVGTYNITAATFNALTGSSAGNYLAPTLSGTPTLTITARALLATLANQTKLYGADDPALAGIVPSLNIVNRGVVTWDGTITVNDTGNVSTTLASLTRQAGEDVGTRNVTAATFTALTGTRAANYSAPTLSGTPTLTITAAPLTATLTNQTKVYGNADPTLASITPTLNGLINRTVVSWNGNVAVNDSANVAVTLASLTRAVGEDVGTRNITSATFNALTGTRAGNYSAPTLSGTPSLTITPRPLTATLANQTKVYGADDPTLASIVPILNVVNATFATWNGAVTVNDTGAVATTLANLDRVAGEDVGTRNVTAATFNPLTGSKAANYSAPTLSGTPTLTITPAPLSGSIANQTKIYGDDDPLLSGILVTLAPVNRTVTTWDAPVAINDTGNVTASVTGITRTAGENVGTHSITAATLSTPSGSQAHNYSNVATFTGTPTLTITQRALTATLANQTKVYGDDDPLLSGIVPTLNAVNRSVVTWNGAVAVDDRARVATTLSDLNRASGETVGTYNVTGATFTALTGSSAANYLAPTLSGIPTLRITARAACDARQPNQGVRQRRPGARRNRPRTQRGQSQCLDVGWRSRGERHRRSDNHRRVAHAPGGRRCRHAKYHSGNFHGADRKPLDQLRAAHAQRHTDVDHHRRAADGDAGESEQDLWR
ncbi:MBG domain-containing protein [Peristeroidobacter soli]|uniref:MBG domain-containing protein n=1 Tax=Peristeroidobacter soli TaxID=2497877 RepID=UPI00158C894E|nr:MBG domain-containing protein [Peristeroidobacter soli]